VSVVTRTRSPRSTAPDALEEVVDLALRRPHLDGRVHDAGGPDELLDDVALRLLQLVRPGRRAHVDDLVEVVLELLEGKRPVVQRRGQPEAVLDEDLLARAVVLVHADRLRDGHVALVDDEQPVGREVVEQRPGPRPRRAAGEVARVVLDARAEAQLAHHLQVEGRALAETGGFQRHALRLELRGALLHLRVDVDDRLAQLVGRRHVVRGGVDVQLLALGQQLTGERVQLADALHLVAEELDPDDEVVVGGLQLQGVAAHPEAGARQGLVVALVLEVDELAQHAVAPVAAADPQPDDGGAVVDRRAEAVDAADAGHDDHVAPLEERVRRGVAELVDLVVARRVLLDVRVAPGQVGLRLVVVEVAHEVLDGVLREELAELGVELRGERLVVGQDERRLLDPGDGRGDREGLSGACGPQQHLVLDALRQALGQTLDGRRLIAGRREVGDKLEVGQEGASWAQGAVSG